MSKPEHDTKPEATSETAERETPKAPQSLDGMGPGTRWLINLVLAKIGIIALVVLILYYTL